ncbi:MAG: ABC transporter ATP-binding protein [Acidobacteria bacterium]|nr:ABC transporter ATP-binding protein [Acidobacteriota bacterium]
MEAVRVFDNLNLEVTQGELVAIVGESGAGKSTLLHLLGGLDQVSSGSVFIGEFDIAKMAELDSAHFRNQVIGFVFQHHYLLAEFTARENVAVPLLLGGVSQAQAVERADVLLARVGLAARAEHFPSELSGGEQQRVALARALANRPKLLLADEPTGNLDERTGAEIQALLRQLQREDGLTAVVVTHNREFARACDRVLRLAKGRLWENES